MLVNLSGTVMKADEEDVLRLGLNFIPTPRKVPYTYHVTGVEAALGRARFPPETT